MNKEDLKERTKKFALRIINLSKFLPQNNIGRIIGNQILRSGTSVASNYRAVCRSKSKADFISKLETVIEESDETLFWLELIADSNIIRRELLIDLMNEANEIIAIMVASRKSAGLK